jgi:O-6-methylguanine DNA methyltransferase
MKVFHNEKDVGESNCRAVVRHPLVNVVLNGKKGTADVTPIVTSIAFIINEKSSLVGSFQRNDDVLKPYSMMIREYLDGARTDLSLIKLDFSHCTVFRKAVLRAAQKIPYGSTVSYTRLASMAGYPTAVRAVASVMRNNPYPLVVPCHRVIRSDRTLGGFMGKHSGGEMELKRKLLELEKS